jgi:hypothetical protein
VLVARVTAASNAGKAVTASSTLSCARSVARLTLAAATPGTAARARSTRATHDAQVMPPIGRLSWIKEVMDTL